MTFYGPERVEVSSGGGGGRGGDTGVMAMCGSASTICSPHKTQTKAGRPRLRFIAVAVKLLIELC